MVVVAVGCKVQPFVRGTVSWAIREEGVAEARRLFKRFMLWVPFRVRSKA
jgi:hypothetical protein